MTRTKAKAAGSGNGRGGANDAAPSDLLREAGAEWRLAFRYAAAATKPLLGSGVERVKERTAGGLANRPTLQDRLNPAQTTKGGRLGDAADALLAKLGTPGQLAAKASLGSRALDRVIPDALLEPDEPQESDEEQEPAAAEGPPVTEDEVAEDDEPVADDDEPVAEDEHEAAAEDEAAEDDSEPAPAVPRGEIEHKEIPSQYEHAYTDELENYEHREAYATTGSKAGR